MTEIVKLNTTFENEDEYGNLICEQSVYVGELLELKCFKKENPDYKVFMEVNNTNCRGSKVEQYVEVNSKVYFLDEFIQGLAIELLTTKEELIKLYQKVLGNWY